MRHMIDTVGNRRSVSSEFQSWNISIISPALRSGGSMLSQSDRPSSLPYSSSALSVWRHTSRLIHLKLLAFSSLHSKNTQEWSLCMQASVSRGGPHGGVDVAGIGKQNIQASIPPGWGVVAPLNVWEVFESFRQVLSVYITAYHYNCIALGFQLEDFLGEQFAQLSHLTHFHAWFDVKTKYCHLP